jgi:hypothetical protein
VLPLQAGGVPGRRHSHPGPFSGHRTAYLSADQQVGLCLGALRDTVYKTNEALGAATPTSPDSRLAWLLTRQHLLAASAP